MSKQINFMSPIAYPISNEKHQGIVKQLLPPVNNTNLPFEVDRYAGGGHEPLSVEGVAATTHVTIANTLNRMDNILPKMPTEWPNKNTLKVYPFAGQGLNAYYNRKHLAFFYDKNPLTDEWYFTSSEADIVAHELGHAILDALRPDLWNAASLEVWAFHEAFADIVSMLSIMQYREVLEKIIQQTGGDIRNNNIASDIGENFSKILAAKNSKYNSHYLRSAINNYQYEDTQLLPEKANDVNTLTREPHSFSRVFLGATYDILVAMYEGYRPHHDPVTALSIARNNLAARIGEAVLHAPASVRFFESVATTMLWSDHRRGGQWHEQMKEIFSNRKITNYQVQILSQEKTTGKTFERSEGLTIVCNCKKEKLCNISDNLKIQSNDRLDFVDLEIPRQDAYIHDNEGRLIDSHSVSEKETVRAAEEMIQFLRETEGVSDHWETPFEISNGELKRSLICCCKGGRTPLKTSPEYYKQYKPENNSGCCGKMDQKNKPKKKFKRGCYVRYRVKN